MESPAENKIPSGDIVTSIAFSGKVMPPTSIFSSDRMMPPNTPFAFLPALWSSVLFPVRRLWLSTTKPNIPGQLSPWAVLTTLFSSFAATCLFKLDAFLQKLWISLTPKYWDKYLHVAGPCPGLQTV